MFGNFSANYFHRNLSLNVKKTTVLLNKNSASTAALIETLRNSIIQQAIINTAIHILKFSNKNIKIIF